MATNPTSETVPEPRRRAPFPCGYCGRSYMLPRPRACCSRGREWDIKIIAAQTGEHMKSELPTSNGRLSPELQEISSMLIRLAAELVRGDIMPDTDSILRCKTTPHTDWIRVSGALDGIFDRLRLYGIRIKEIADKLPKQQPDDRFKNFHRLLCERFGYGHDEKDWERDQLSLIEWIAKQCSAHETTTRQPAWEPLKERDKKASDLAYRLRLTNVRALSVDDHNALCRETANMLHQLMADYAELRESPAVEPSPEPHPNGRCKCQFCGAGFVVWGDTSVHERSCSKNPSNAVKASCEHGAVDAYSGRCVACSEKVLPAKCDI